jgi:hypothetical protein
MTDHTNLVGVFYDAKSLAIRRIVVDARDLNTHLRPDEVLATDLRLFGHSFDRAVEIVRGATGREPPPLSEVHQEDDWNRALMGM